MRIGLLLLTQKDAYVDEQGRLPERPAWDKQFLMDITEGMKCEASTSTYMQLPKILRDRCQHNYYDIHLGIDGIENVDLLIITRSPSLADGKRVRLDKFRMILKIEDIELWKHV